MNPIKLHISEDTEELGNHVAQWIVEYIQEVLQLRNRFTIALSGGNTPKKLYRLLASDQYRDKIDWKCLHFFWGDERYVPFTDDQNNAKMAFDTLLTHVPVPREQIHPIPTDIEARLSTVAYDELLHRYFEKQLYTFDLVLLGLGDNAHTLSLFPHYDDILYEQNDWVKGFYLVEQNSQRITLTPPVVNIAGRVAFLIAGSDKTDAIQHVISPRYEPSEYPAQLIKPRNGELYWFLDKSAAAGLQYAI